ncbi:MAG: hypothetical protein D3913_08010 [Candidatus Electrothrix sp. LOE1_4_5]|nr:hypothetical protein [Candidatus Electrothrix gigas]
MGLLLSDSLYTTGVIKSAVFDTLRRSFYFSEIPSASPIYSAHSAHFYSMQHFFIAKFSKKQYLPAHFFLGMDGCIKRT